MSESPSITITGRSADRPGNIPHIAIIIQIRAEPCLYKTIFIAKILPADSTPAAPAGTNFTQSCIEELRIDAALFWDMVMRFLEDMQFFKPKKASKECQGVKSLRIPGPHYITHGQVPAAGTFCTLDPRQIKAKEEVLKYVEDDGDRVAPANVVGGFVVVVNLMTGFKPGEDFDESLDSFGDQSDSFFTLDTEGFPSPFSAIFKSAN